MQLTKRGYCSVDGRRVRSSGVRATVDSSWRNRRYQRGGDAGLTDAVLDALQAANTSNDPTMGVQALCWSAGWGKTTTLAALLAMGLNPNAANEKGELPLTLASGKGWLDACRALVEHGADVNAVDGEGLSALIRAASLAHFEVASFLYSVYADLDARDPHGMTTLMWAARFHDLPAVFTALDHGADINARDHEGQTALWWAATDQTIVELLKNRGGVE